ncbi:MAG: MotA/TolQ/ExbB proton channel family protein [bacterium]
MDSFNLDLVTLVRSASLLAKLVLALLLILSIVTWGIIIEKAWLFGKGKKARAAFAKYNWLKFDPEQLRATLNKHRETPITRVFHRIFLDYYSVQRHIGDEDALTRMLHKQGSLQSSRLESRLGILASVGSASPFIGLFGTVWGVMRSFMNIGTWGSTSLAVVAPGIAEALIATAAGLVAAIPAVIAYNYFVGSLKHEARALEDFSADLILAERARNRQEQQFYQKRPASDRSAS